MSLKTKTPRITANDLPESLARKYKTIYKARMSHTCKNLMIYCMDFRLEEALHQWLVDKGMDHDTDQVSLAGAIKDLVSPQNPGEAEMILKQIGLSADLHNIERVVLVNHTDCGGYGGKKAFDHNDEAEKTKHSQDMRRAKEIIQDKWPHLEVMMVLADIKHDGTIKFLEM